MAASLFVLMFLPFRGLVSICAALAGDPDFSLSHETDPLIRPGVDMVASVDVR